MTGAGASREATAEGSEREEAVHQHHLSVGKPGLVGKSGERIRLETINFGGQICSTAEALQRHFERLSDERPIALPEPQLSKRRQREIAAAKRYCEEQGL